MIAKTKLSIRIPDGVRFADLKLARDSQTGDISFDWEPINKICAASGIDPRMFTDTHEDNVSALIVQWYISALKNGEPRDAVQDDLIGETIAEDQRGGGLSHQPGRA